MKIIFLISVLLILVSCENSETTNQPVFYDNNKIEDTLIKAVKYLLVRDKELIQSYVKRRSWNMQISESGLWYEVYKKTNNKKVEFGNIVKYNYTIELLDGTLCYSSDSTGFGNIKIGQSGKESGLEEGLIMMRAGEKAHFILPPHIAHGLIGNMDRIPHRSTIVYDVEILNVVDF